ncbi:alkaline phosphatase [Hahella sp. CCB-MM4]|uniref:choice-of-anchor I family protein n=1 Tax=Hahella sp. (strain CCB-MM4) TaxID=1926491 RepID=UPI000B9C2744|nr:choice-of-anchor I family protein [Hahella sp. CCB-MM4]OZG73173.1 alkaline phosphatase [Hahella sp. CCB-MM4]
MKLHALAIALGLVVSTGASAQHFFQPIVSLELLGQHQTGVFDEGAAEIVAYDSRNQRIFKVNADAAAVEVLDIHDPSHPLLIGTIDASALGGSANSVAVHKGLVAVAIEAENTQEPGVVAFYDAMTLTLLNTLPVGALPDMVTFTPNGRYALVANEGEPNDDYTVDPEGSVSIVDLRHGVKYAEVRTADFSRYNGMKEVLQAKGVRVYGPGSTVAQDFEPEYIAVSRNSRYAWVSLQEANAMAVVDIKKAKVIDIQPLGTKDHSLPGNELDASNKDDGINITNWPVKGMYMPDSIASYSFFGQTYIVTANEGDSRDYDGYSEEERVKDLDLDPTAFPNAAMLQESENLGRLKVTTANGDTDGDGDFDELYSYGARSFSIRSAYGRLVYDSGSDFERITAERIPENFNSNNDENGSFDSRSDDKGPEPEGVTLGRIYGQTYAFIGLERVGGIMVYDITNPYRVSFVDYFTSRNFEVDAQLPDDSVNPLVGDLGPEGLTFIPAHQSPNRKPLLVVGNEVSGTTSIIQINVDFPWFHLGR